MQCKANYNVFIYFQVILLRSIYIATKRNETNTKKKNLLKKLDVVVMEK